MTARAFLRLSEGLREAFTSAQDDETLRYLRVEVVHGDCLEAVGSKQKGELETDFDALAQASARQASRQTCNAMPRVDCIMLLLRMVYKLHCSYHTPGALWNTRFCSVCCYEQVPVPGRFRTSGE